MQNESKNSARIEALKKTELFCRIDESSWQVICEETEIVRLEAGQVLLGKGELVDAIYVLLEGELESTDSDSTSSQSSHRYIKPYTCIGEIQVLRGGRQTESILAKSACRLIRIPEAALENLSINTPGEFQKIVEVVRKRVREDQLRLILPQLFGSLDERAFAHIENHIEWIHLRRGEVLCRQGDPGDCVYIVISGRLRAIKDHGSLDEKPLNDVGRGELLGEMAFVTGGERSATLYAVRDSELVKISRDIFEIFANEHPRTLLSIGQTLTRRILKAEGAQRRAKIQLNLALVNICNDPGIEAFMPVFTKALSAGGAVCHLTSALINDMLGFPQIAHISDNDPLIVKLSAWLDEQEAACDIMVYESDEGPTSWTRRCLRNADKVLFLVPGGKVPADAGDEMISLVEAACADHTAREFLFIHPETVHMPSGTIQWLNALPAANFYHLRRDRAGDIQRTVRFLTGNAINLVFSGGAACGLAHIGVIRALEENGVPIDSISGTSMGAVIASQYAMGMGYQALLRNNHWLWVASRPMRDYTVPMISFLRGRKLERIARAIYGDTQIEDLWLPFFCISTSLTSVDQVVHRKGPLFDAIRATTSVPGLVPPAVIENEILVDGGIMNNLPVGISRRVFKGLVIAVDVTEAKVLRIPGNGFPSPWRLLWDRMRKAKDRNSVPGIFDIMYHSAIVGSQRRTEQAGKEADLYLRLPLDNYKFLQFESFDEIVEMGYRFTNEQIKEWKRGLPAFPDAFSMPHLEADNP